MGRYNPASNHDPRLYAQRRRPRLNKQKTFWQLNTFVGQTNNFGWQDALPGNQDKQIFEGDWSAANGERGLRQLLKQYPDMNAVFACNDQMALGALQAAHQLGRPVPEELGLVGFDNTPESAYFWPPLTTVRHQLIEQGKIVVEKLAGLIEAEPQTKKTIQPEATLLQPQLIVRKSSVV